MTIKPYGISAGPHGMARVILTGSGLPVTEFIKEARAVHIAACLNVFRDIPDPEKYMRDLSDTSKSLAAVQQQSHGIVEEIKTRLLALRASHARLLEAIKPLVFAAESVAHLKRLERELLPACDEARAAIAAAEAIK